MTTTEKIEILKGEFRTTIVIDFSKIGEMTSFSSRCVNINETEMPILRELKDQLFNAVTKGDKNEVITLQEKINAVRM